MRVLVVVLLLFGLMAPTIADDKPDPEKPVSIDFVQKSLKAIVEWCATKAGAKTEFAEDFEDAQVTISIKDRKALDIAREACKQHGYYIVVEEVRWRVRKAALSDDGKVTAETTAGRYRAEFAGTGHIRAIMTIAKATETEVFVPTLPEEPGKPPRAEQRGAPVIETPVKLTVRYATPDYLLREIARQAGMTVEFDPESGGYTFGGKK